ncbi:hypothetical protein [Streptomyces luteireticuli]|uniref:hypothetical protein n=1 Tax=Streptomyces luteireticuli TaxID=173858 RepID=UPI0035563D68
MPKPLLFLDVDGPLNPYVAPAEFLRAHGYVRHRMLPESWVAEHAGKPRSYIRPLTVWLNPGHGLQLMGLPFELVWATTWEEDANSWIGPRIGLPSLPVVTWSPSAAWPDGAFAKAPDLVTQAGGRPFAWVDDQIRPADREHVARRHRGPALLHHVDPAAGLGPADFTALAHWAAALPATPTGP